MFKQVVLATISLSISTGMALSVGTTVLAQDDPYTPEQRAAALKFVQSINTPEKQAKWLRQNYKVAVSQKWPTNFPLPVYNSNVLTTTFTNSTQGAPSAAANLSTSDPPRRVFEFYKSACERGGWKIKMPSAKAMADMGAKDDVFFLTADQPKQSINLTCTKDPKNGGTVVSISWRKKV